MSAELQRLQGLKKLQERNKLWNELVSQGNPQKIQYRQATLQNLPTLIKKAEQQNKYEKLKTGINKIFSYFKKIETPKIPYQKLQGTYNKLREIYEKKKISGKKKKYQLSDEVEMVRRTSKFGGDAIVEVYRWKNPQNMSEDRFMEVMGKLGGQNITLPVKMSDGRIEPKTIKFQHLKTIAEQNFILNTKQIGSDADYAQEGEIDFTREFAVMTLKQKSQLKASCNSKKTVARQLKNCVVIDPYTRNRNCGFACLKYLGLEHDIPLSQQGPLTPQQLLDICRRNNLPVEILIDELQEFQISDEMEASLDEFQIQELREQYRELKSIDKSHENLAIRKGFYKLVHALKNGVPHYYVFQAMSMTKKEKKEDKIKELQQKKKWDSKIWINVFYDLETVFDHDDESFAKTYSCVYLDVDQEFFNKTIITPQNIGEFKERSKFLTGTNVCEQMVNQLCKKYDTEKYKFRFISFNGSNFDDYFLLQQAKRYGETVHATYQSKSILGLTFSYGQCWDLKKFLTVGSLDGLCESFNVYPAKVKGFDHMEPQLAFEDGQLEQWIEKNREKLVEYNQLDVLSLYSLTQKFRDNILNLIKSDVFEYQTIGNHSYKLARKQWDDSIKMLLKAPLTEEDDLFIRKCLTAGRCQVMASKNGEFVHVKGKRLSMVDVVSLYPYVMLLHNNYYPAGNYKWVQTRDKGKLGFYMIRVKQREDMPNVLPKRNFEDPSQPLDWNCKEEYITYCTSVDLDVLEEFNNQFTVIKGVEFEQKISGEIIFASLLPFKQEKIRQDVLKELYEPARSHLYNQALRETCKIYLNSLSGKVIQRNFDDVTQIIRTRKELHSFLDQCSEDTASISFQCSDFTIAHGKKMKTYSPKSAKPSYLGVYIYSHARKHMYENIYSLIDVKYTDTDSGLCEYDQELKLRQLRPELFTLRDQKIDGNIYQIKEFGTLDCELKPYANEAILLQPKNYFVGNRDNVVLNQKTGKYEPYLAKLKCKGVSFKSENCRYVPDQLKTDYITPYCYRSLNQSLKSDPFRLYDTLMEKGEVKVACEQLIVKSIRSGKERFGVAVRHIIKTIKLQNLTYDVLD